MRTLCRFCNWDVSRTHIVLADEVESTVNSESHREKFRVIREVKKVIISRFLLNWTLLRAMANIKYFVLNNQHDMTSLTITFLSVSFYRSKMRANIEERRKWHSTNIVAFVVYEILQFFFLFSFFLFFFFLFVLNITAI